MNHDLQHKIAKLVLSKIASYGFVLSGGLALVELDITDRPTQDIDFFTSNWQDGRFVDAVESAIDALNSEGYEVNVIRSLDSFTQIEVKHGGDTIDIDFGYDYREFPPATVEVGPVLDARDAVLNKISALYARSLARDFIDVYEIREKSIMSDSELLAQSAQRDEGFVIKYFIESLRRIELLPYDDFKEYGISKEKYKEIKDSILMWAETIE
jgi:hypothetical protein